VIIHRRSASIGRCVQALMAGGAMLSVAAVVAQRAAGVGAEMIDAAAKPDRQDQSPGDRRVPQQADCKTENFKVALDVGHTPEAPGATSARGVKELAFNLQLAGRIKDVLMDGGFPRTVLITSHGLGRAQLAKRTEQASRLGADLLLSIHHDDVQDSYHRTWTHAGAPHAYSDRFSGYSLFVSRDNRHFEESLVFARLLGAQLAARGLRYSAHHAEPVRDEARQLLDSSAGVYQYDELYVLKFSASPAVLLEAGIIVNRADELALASPERQGHISAAVLAALNEFCTTPGARR
jgi:N-acetylmuramoyl-L-alanine amidase